TAVFCKRSLDPRTHVSIADVIRSVLDDLILVNRTRNDIVVHVFRCIPRHCDWFAPTRSPRTFAVDTIISRTRTGILWRMQGDSSWRLLDGGASLDREFGCGFKSARRMRERAEQHEARQGTGNFSHIALTVDPAEKSLNRRSSLY